MSVTQEDQVLLDPSETVVTAVGRGYVASALAGEGFQSKGLILSDQRLYHCGKFREIGSKEFLNGLTVLELRDVDSYSAFRSWSLLRLFFGWIACWLPMLFGEAYLVVLCLILMVGWFFIFAYTPASGVRVRTPSVSVQIDFKLLGSGKIASFMQELGRTISRSSRQ